MATGDVVAPSRPNFGPNERLEQVDVDSTTQVARAYADAVSRAVQITPKATAGAPTGMLLTGGSVTVNPSNPTDGTLRINNELLVALDANGRLLIKQAGVSLSVSVPAGVQQQIYIYYLESSSGSAALRRFITAGPPFTEAATAWNITNSNGVGVWVRTGGIGSVVPDDVIGGVTTPLLFIGLATNTGGSVVFDGTGATNRMSTIEQPSAFPTDGVHNGSMRTLLDMVKAALFMVARDRWKGETNNKHITGNGAGAAPAVGNNFFGYAETPFGIDATYRKTGSATVTIGDGVASFGDYDATDFASSDLVLQAAINALSATGGGTILLKRNVLLQNFLADITIPAQVDITIQGPGVGTVNVNSQIYLGSHKIAYANSSFQSTLTLRDLQIQGDGTFLAMRNNALVMENCSVSAGGASAVPAITAAGAGATNCIGWYFRNCSFSGGASAQSSSNVLFVDTGGLPTSNFTITDCSFQVNSACSVMISILDARSDISISDTAFIFSSAVSTSTYGAGIVIGANANTPTAQSGRVISNCRFVGSNTNAAGAAMDGIKVPCGAVNGFSNLQIANCDFQNVASAVFVSGSAQLSNVQIGLCKVLTSLWGVQFTNSGTVAQFTIADTDFLNCTNGSVSGANGTVTSYTALTMHNCVCSDAQLLLSGATASCKVTQCFFIGNVFTSATPNTNATCKPPTITAGNVDFGGCYSLRFSKNHVEGFGNTANELCVGFQVAGAQIHGCQINDNSFKNLQNVAYAGSVGLGARVIEVDACSITGLQISRNIMTSVQRYTGAADGITGTVTWAKSVMLNTFGTLNGSTIIEWDSIQITNNQFGDIEYGSSIGISATWSIMVPFACIQTAGLFGGCRSFRFANNIVGIGDQNGSVTVNSGTITADCYIRYGRNSATVNNGAVEFTDNQFYYQSVRAAWGRDLLLIETGSTGQNTSSAALQFESNRIITAATASFFGSNKGINTQSGAGNVSIGHIILKHNSAVYSFVSGSQTDGFRTNFGTAGTNFGRIIPAYPTTATEYADNLNVYRT